MEISYLGKTGYKIKAKQGAMVAEADKLTISHKGGGDDFVIDKPGEYEVEGISVFGYGAEANNVYVVQSEDMRVLYLGDLTRPLSEKNITDLENIDVMIVSTDSMASKDLVELIAKLEPYFVLPYGEQVEKFIAAYEHGSRSVKNLSLSKLSLSEDLTEVITFEN